MEQSIEQLKILITLWTPKVLSALLILAGFYVASRIATTLMRRFLSVKLNNDVVEVIASAARIIVFTFGGITALGTLGVDVSALVAGLGLTGFAIGFALKDVISNVLAGILVLMYQPFKRGDIVEIGSLKGSVMSIELRYTRLRSEDGSEILIPNSNLMTTNIVISHSTSRGVQKTQIEPTK